MQMNKNIKIEGMMCGHYKATVKKTLEALGQVTEGIVSHDARTAIVSLSGDVDDAAISRF